jgi:hypothetical protein
MCTFLTKKTQRKKEGKRDYKEGYSTFSPAELSNEMLDDLKLFCTRVSSGTEKS